MLKNFKLSLVALLIGYSQYSNALGECNSGNVGATDSVTTSQEFQSPSCGGNKTVTGTAVTTTYYRCVSTPSPSGLFAVVGWQAEYSVTQYNVPLDVDCPAY